MLRHQKKKLKKNWTKTNFEAIADPFIYEGILYTATNGSFYAINPETGDFIWEYKIPGKATLPIFNNNYIIFGGYYIDCTLYALDKNTGKEIWTCRLGPNSASVLAEPICLNNLIYVFTGKTIYSISLENGKKTNSFKLKKKGARINIIIEDNKLYATTRNQLGKEEIECIDLQANELLWQIKTPNIGSNLIYCNQHLYYLNTNTELCEINPITGEMNSSKIVEVKNRVTNLHLCYNGTALYLCIGYHIIAFNITTSPWSLLWNFHSNATIGKMVVTKEVVYFATMGNGFFGLNTTTGKELFHENSEVRTKFSCAISPNKIIVAGSMSELELTAYSEKE
ncbi:PQQ-binding-like beta-propeller repeat protein [Flavobacterium jejuense]|uniref:PQQ-binding-like beta-propeller repeat protein n=1 Tax=Flavobacterium jejuense TaxID=1544455 RepID=A0ABX0J0S5_9FLAO|nr:PQQ-binding-like beta-propeller repeat protein [Flavobacterium jejuense]NHN27594.1 PQQ-binding-like beta-propeller repeat protein [Flavobacterium jejuense]